MRNYRDDLRALRGALKPGGKLFVHVFIANTRFSILAIIGG